MEDRHWWKKTYELYLDMIGEIVVSAPVAVNTQPNSSDSSSVYVETDTKHSSYLSKHDMDQKFAKMQFMVLANAGCRIRQDDKVASVVKKVRQLASRDHTFQSLACTLEEEFGVYLETLHVFNHKRVLDVQSVYSMSLSDALAEHVTFRSLMDSSRLPLWDNIPMKEKTNLKNRIPLLSCMNGAIMVGSKTLDAVVVTRDDQTIRLLSARQSAIPMLKKCFTVWTLQAVESAWKIKYAKLRRSVDFLINSIDGLKNEITSAEYAHVSQMYDNDAMVRDEWKLVMDMTQKSINRLGSLVELVPFINGEIKSQEIIMGKYAKRLQKFYTSSRKGFCAYVVDCIIGSLEMDIKEIATHTHDMIDACEAWRNMVDAFLDTVCILGGNGERIDIRDSVTNIMACGDQIADALRAVTIIPTLDEKTVDAWKRDMDEHRKMCVSIDIITKMAPVWQSIRGQIIEYEETKTDTTVTIGEMKNKFLADLFEADQEHISHTRLSQLDQFIKTIESRDAWETVGPSITRMLPALQQVHDRTHSLFTRLHEQMDQVLELNPSVVATAIIDVPTLHTSVSVQSSKLFFDSIRLITHHLSALTDNRLNEDREVCLSAMGVWGTMVNEQVPVNICLSLMPRLMRLLLYYTLMTTTKARSINRERRESQSQIQQ